MANTIGLIGGGGSGTEWERDPVQDVDTTPVEGFPDAGSGGDTNDDEEESNSNNQQQDSGSTKPGYIR